jgi:hypothetical protein
MSRAALFAVIAAVALPASVAWGTAAWASTAPIEDRYGPEAPPLPAERPHPSVFLNWPGKTAPTLPAQAAAAPSSAAVPMPAALPAPPPRRTARADLPTSLYAASPARTQAAAAPLRQASPAPAPRQASAPSSWRSQSRYATADGAAPRRYSVAREFGVKPDPTPLPQQFFGPSVDLADPPPLPPPKQVTGQNTNTAANQARADLQTPVAGDLSNSTGSN